MSKVILTQEQAESLELTLEKANENKDLALGWISPALHHRKPLNKKFSSLKELSVGEIARALYIGYEVEPEFKVGEYVVYENEVVKNTMKIIDTEAGDILVEPIYEGFEDYNRVSVNSPSLRHATPKEIAEEKERRWWSGHNRGTWELKKDDCLISKNDKHSCNVKFVEDCDDKGVLLVDGIKDEYISNAEELKNKYVVFCFAEQRLDVKDDE